MIMQISEKLRYLREKVLEMSSQEFAQICGVSIKTVYAWEKGNSKPCLDNLISISNTFNIALDYLLIEDYPMEFVFTDLEDEIIDLLRKITEKMKEKNRN
jgi:transcriptional regulator with XRE-family HTH domain